jgi:predicted GIY-YIG superfamily endonuclease
MDIDIPPETQNPDAEHTELQSRYTSLQQEYHNFSIQHETLASKFDTQCKRIEILENENASIEGRLANYTLEHQQLNNAYNRVMQEHNACQSSDEQLQDMVRQWKEELEKNTNLNTTCAALRQELKNYTLEHQQLNNAYNRVMQEHNACQSSEEQLQDMVRRWKEELEKNTNLNTTCAALRQELKSALENRTPTRSPSRVEQVDPVAIEATTMSELQDSDDEQLSDVAPYIWTAGPDDRSWYEIFLVYTVAEEGELQGYSFTISRSSEEAIPQITNALRQAETVFGSDHYHAITVLGMNLINTEPAYLFGCLRANRTIFVGRNSMLATYVAAGASSSQLQQSVVTIEEAATQALEAGSSSLGKRKLGRVKNITAKRRRDDTKGVGIKGKRTKPLGILRSKKAAAAAKTSTQAEPQAYNLFVPGRNFDGV